MPKLSSIAEVREMDADFPIPAIKGKLTALYPVKKGESEKGPWSFQNGELTQGNQKIKIVFKGRDPVPMSTKGKEITLLSFHGDRGVSGLYASDNDYNGTVTREIKVTSTAEMIEGTGAGALGEQPQQNQEQPRQSNGPSDRSGFRESPNPPQPARQTVNPFQAGVNGATVGMAVNNSITILNGMGAIPFLPDGEVDPKWYGRLHKLASSIIRCSRVLEDGKLAPSPLAKKEQAPPPQPPPPPAPEPEPEAVNDDDIPM